MYIKIIEHIEKLRFSTCPIFRIENEIPKIQGTCSFIKYKGFHFIITAQHVLQDFENNLYIPIENNSRKLIKPSGVSFLDEINDIGIILLDELTVGYIKMTYQFIEYKDSNTNNENTNSSFSFIGFPETKGRFNKYKDRIYIEPIIFTTKKAEKRVVEKVGIDSEDKICVKYDKNNIYNIIEGKYKTGPDLYGISGCLLIQHYDNELNIKGILTHWCQKNKTILIGTKSMYISQILSYVIRLTCS